MKSYRISFEKRDGAVYISHLDMSRMFARALLRADVKIMYSEGFNPHPKITFTPPISLGTESFAEFCDVKTDDAETAEGILERLRSAMPSGITVKSVYVPKLPFSDMFCTEYLIQFEFDNPEISPRDLESFFSGRVIIEKKTKTKVVQIDVTDYIGDAKFFHSGEYVCMKALFESNSVKYLNPDYAVKAVCEKFGAADVKITKIAAYTIGREIFA